MIDSIKTVVVGVSGVGIWWIDMIHPVLQLFISIATLIYIILKIRREA